MLPLHACVCVSDVSDDKRSSRVRLALVSPLSSDRYPRSIRASYSPYFNLRFNFIFHTFQFASYFYGPFIPFQSTSTAPQLRNLDSSTKTLGPYNIPSQNLRIRICVQSYLLLICYLLAECFRLFWGVISWVALKTFSNPINRQIEITDLSLSLGISVSRFQCNCSTILYGHVRNNFSSTIPPFK